MFRKRGGIALFRETIACSVDARIATERAARGSGGPGSGGGPLADSRRWQGPRPGRRKKAAASSARAGHLYWSACRPRSRPL